VAGHRLAEERSLAYHAEVARRLLCHPAVLEAARARVRAWLDRTATPPYYAREWAAVLAERPEAVAAFLIDRGERARELRQSTPFAGALSPQERWRIWHDVRMRHRDTA
jgi:hypothetical protein